MNSSITVCVYDDHTLYEQGLKKFDYNTVCIYDPSYLKYWQSLYNTVKANDKEFRPLDWLTLKPGENAGYFHKCDSLSKEEFITEFKKRYLFLQKNYLFLLAPLIKEESDDAYQMRKIDCERINAKFIPEKQIYIGIDKYLFSFIENFMFYYKKGTDGWIEKHPLYRKVEKLKNNKEYLEEVERGLTILEKEKKDKNLDSINLSLFDLFLMMRGFIKAEQNFSSAKKIRILEEYFRVCRHDNSNKYWESGFKLTDSDIKRNLNDDWHEICGRNCHSVLYLHGPGCFNTPFIEGFSKMERGFKEIPIYQNGRIIGYKKIPDYQMVTANLSPEDCLKLYIEGHDELAYNLSGQCCEDDSIKRPEGTKPCLSSFSINEENIFCLGDNFYHLCSGCGYIVNITDKITNPRIGRRIINRCSEDSFSLKKHLLLSELTSLDSDYKRLVKGSK